MTFNVTKNQPTLIKRALYRQCNHSLKLLSWRQVLHWFDMIEVRTMVNHIASQFHYFSLLTTQFFRQEKKTRTVVLTILFRNYKNKKQKKTKTKKVTEVTRQSRLGRRGGIAGAGSSRRAWRAATVSSESRSRSLRSAFSPTRRRTSPPKRRTSPTSRAKSAADGAEANGCGGGGVARTT